ncbi:MAG TPA: hypothetical protein VE685_09565 [Thermoanaerobaculia bacterium]|nr:hypothetical protein [Thermoanaerobaculia bacterium]
MNRIKLISKVTLAFALAAGTLVGTIEAKPKPTCPQDILCPTYYDPVICSDGKVYSNQCFATAACATGCVPYGAAL